MGKAADKIKSALTSIRIKNKLSLKLTARIFKSKDLKSVRWLEEMKKPSTLKLQSITRRNFLHELELLSGILKYYAEYKDDPHFVYPIKRRHRVSAIVKLNRSRKRKPMTPQQFETWEIFSVKKVMAR